MLATSPRTQRCARSDHICLRDTLRNSRHHTVNKRLLAPAEMFGRTMWRTAVLLLPRRLRVCSQRGSKGCRSWCRCTCSPTRVWSPPCFMLLTGKKPFSRMRRTIQVTTRLVWMNSQRTLFFFSCWLSFILLLDGEDEKPPLPPRLASTSTPPASETPTDRYKVSVWKHFFVFIIVW